jgi:hypothetical protein
MGERWNQKLAAFRAQLVARMRPIKVEPKHTIRHSGPRLMPSDWMDPEKQRFMGDQCAGCHQNQPFGVTLRAGFCGPCWMARLERRHVVNGPDDLPPAA